MCRQQDQLKLSLCNSFSRIFLYRMPHLSLRWLHSQRNCQSLERLVGLNGLWSRDCPLGLMPIISGHAGNLWSISYQVQNMQVAAICLSGAGGAFKGSFLQGLHCHFSDLVVHGQSFGHTPGPRHHHQGICINASLLCLIVQLKIVVGNAGHPLVTYGIQLCYC